MMPDFSDPNWKFMGLAKLRGLEVNKYRLSAQRGTEPEEQPTFDYLKEDY